MSWQFKCSYLIASHTIVTLPVTTWTFWLKEQQENAQLEVLDDISMIIPAKPQPPFHVLTLLYLLRTHIHVQCTCITTVYTNYSIYIC